MKINTFHNEFVPCGAGHISFFCPNNYKPTLDKAGQLKPEDYNELVQMIQQQRLPEKIGSGLTFVVNDASLKHTDVSLKYDLHSYLFKQKETL